MHKTFALAIHGGAGTILKSSMTPEKEFAYQQGLQNALTAGSDILKQGGSALDAVTAAVVSLENFPLFNAGKGSVFTNSGSHEMDASLMCGKTRAAGAVAGVQKVRNPVVLAKAVMEQTEHVFLAGTGALEFAKSIGLPTETEEYFYNEFRFQQWQEALKTDSILLDHTDDKKFGTVGAVARDLQGNLAAATSTGGMTNKRWGRIGDSPVIGAGTFAWNDTCAISCTGHGEYFLRYMVAYDVSCLMEYAGKTLEEACRIVVLDKLKSAGGEGGLIAVSPTGNPFFCFNSEGMYRGFCTESQMLTAIYEE